MKIHTSFKMILGTGFHQSKPWAIVLLILIFVGLFVIPAAASDPAMTQIGQSGITGSISAADVTVQVKNESGSTVSGAKVYHEGSYIGVTNTSGTITVNNVVVGDTLAASYLVYTEPAVKAGHTMGGSSAWAWRVYLTSVDIPDSGTPQLFKVSDTSQVQVLTVRKDQALIGVHIVAVVEFDATSAYLDDLEQSLINASAFLYDVTDGQMLYEIIEIYDDAKNGAASDYVFLADNSVGPNASIGGMAKSTGRILFPPIRGSNGSNQDADDTMIHEFGHYGLSLYDEYRKRDGSIWSSCTLNRYTNNDETTRASIMDNEHNASELCSRADSAHVHNTATAQDAMNNGETTWETVMRVFNDQQAPSRWTLQSPDTRHVTVVSGPTSIPVTDWVTTSVDNEDTGACDPFIAMVTDYYNNPVQGVEVEVDSLMKKPLYQGITDKVGEITVRGAHNGDTLDAKKGDMWGELTINCPTTSTPTVVIIPKIENLFLKFEPLIMGRDTVEVKVISTIGLPEAPELMLWQYGALEPISVDLIYHPELMGYIGQVPLNSSLDFRVQAQAIATDALGGTFEGSTSFILQSLDSERVSWVQSDDGQLSLFLPPGSLSGSPSMIIQEASQVNLHQGPLSVLGDAYEIKVSTGEVNLQTPAALSIHFSIEAGILQQRRAFGLFRWEPIEQSWILINPEIDFARQYASANITQLGTYAILARPLFITCLPLAIR